MTVRILGLLLTVAGIAGLTLGVLGIFGSNVIAVSPWALTILGFIFFVSGIGLLKRQPD